VLDHSDFPASHQRPYFSFHRRNDDDRNPHASSTHLRSTSDTATTGPKEPLMKFISQWL
jgi:hypothetical protein